MTRERKVDLVSYLPPFVAEYKEINATLTAENPEFEIAWDAANRVLYNEFIATADEYGISRFEKILNIFPSVEDTLESRRARVAARWFTSIPYTEKVFLEKLITLCGENNFTLTKAYENYRIELEVDLELFGQVEELERIIDTMLPCNMVIIANNKIPCKANGFALFAGGICAVENFFITNDEKYQKALYGAARFGGGVSSAAVHFVTNDSREVLVARGAAIHGAGVVGCSTVVLTNDFNEQFSITGANTVASGGAMIELIEIE